MNTHLFAAIISAALSLFNLYYFIQRGTGTYLVLFAIWIFVAFKNFKQYKANKDKNSKNNA